MPMWTGSDLRQQASLCVASMETPKEDCIVRPLLKHRYAECKTLQSGVTMKQALQKNDFVCHHIKEQLCRKGLHCCVTLSHLSSLASRGKKGHEDQGGLDRISGLPNDILLNHIISPLGMKEVARMGILSKRWRDLWGHSTNLNFDYDVISSRYVKFDPNRFISWVDGVLKMHCGPSIHKFTIRLKWYYSEAVIRCMDTWVKFALSKGVKELELALNSPDGSGYTLGIDIFRHSCYSSSANIHDHCFRSLTSLILSNIGVSGEFLEFILSTCCFLESLSVQRSVELVDVKVRSSSLKHLSLEACYNLKAVELDAVNLISLRYYDTRCDFLTKFMFQNVLSLVIVAVGGQCCFPPFPIFGQITSSCLQISKLLLELSDAFNDCHWPYDIPAGTIPTFASVKHLVVCLDDRGSDFLRVLRFIEACPSLETLELQIFRYKTDPLPASPALESHELEEIGECLEEFEEALECEHVEFEETLELKHLEFEGTPANVDFEEFDEKSPTTLGEPHQTLSLLKVKGFMGSFEDVDLILHIVDYAITLKTIICDPHEPRTDVVQSHIIEASRSRAAKLLEIIPPRVEVIVVK